MSSASSSNPFVICIKGSRIWKYENNNKIISGVNLDLKWHWRGQNDITCDILILKITSKMWGIRARAHLIFRYLRNAFSTVWISIQSYFMSKCSRAPSLCPDLVGIPHYQNCKWSCKNDVVFNHNVEDRHLFPRAQTKVFHTKQMLYLIS